MMVLSASEGQRKENLPLRASSGSGSGSGISGSSSDSSSTLSKRRPKGFGKASIAPEGDHGLVAHRPQQLQRQQSGSSADLLLPTNADTFTGILVLMCTQNALALQTRTQLGLCPPGRNRRTLLAALRTKPIRSSSFPGNALVASAKDDDYLSVNANIFEADEGESSGDDDELFDVKELVLGKPTLSTRTTTIQALKEPIFTPTGEEHNKLPFRFRKLRYFDAASASDRRLARDYLRNELKKSKRRALFHRLQKEPDVVDGMSRFDDAARLSSSLLLESLLLDPLESVEGMAKCYEGIVAAGVALQQNGTRSQVLKALSPLLISSLEKVSGQVILNLAKVRRLCGTPRYQRRFVQRIGPYLVRPPQAAPWCLRHQHDMEAILAACELILDSAEDVFSGNWYEKGRQLLRDSVRKQTLNVAAQQLKDLSPARSVFWPARRFTATLAEWEVMAVDRQIRISIANIFTQDWSKVVAMPAREPDVKSRRRVVSKQVLQSPKSPVRNKAPKFHSIHGAPPAPDDVDAPLSPAAGVVKTPPRSPSSPPNTPISRDALRSPPPPPHHEPWLQAPPPITPLSPQVSIASASEVPSRMSSNVSVASTGSASLQATHYRMLTSTAAERKRTVAACRALRSQIQRFEEAFMQLHGRPPKGASERAPLATTYAQYREWKRAIRADAACRIQALVRGARTRWLLLRSSNSRLARVVMTRAGRASAGGGNSTNVSLEKLSIPIDISADPDRKMGVLTPIPHVKKVDGGDLFISSGSPRQLSPVTPPSWSTSVQPRRSLSPNSFATSPSAVNNSATSNDLMHLSLPDLQARKRDLKQQLKQYDMNFARKHGRMPVKAEKEPIRHVYEMYNTLKSRISAVEQQEQEQQQQKKPAAVTAIQAKQHPQQSRPMQRTPTPSMSVTSAGASDRLESDQSSEIMARGSRQSSGNISNTSSSKAKQEQLQQQQQQLQLQQHQQQQQQQQQTVYSPAPPSLDPPPPLLAGGAAHELANLKTEKAKLHQMLRSYEKDFFKEHGRQVSSFAEIKPVASQYRRYKEIKKAIAVLQLQVDGGSH